MTKRLKSIAALFLFATVALTSNGQILKSPDGALSMKFTLTGEGTPQYTLDFKGKTVVNPSRLGFEIKRPNRLKTAGILKTVLRLCL